jgi:recombination protein RecA
MSVLKRRAQQVEKGLTTSKKEEEENVNMDNVVSTGSTLLDLAISGRRRRGGGLPGGILTEIYGPSGWGKTSLLGEICASAQSKGGLALIGDAERRMTPEFIKYMGIHITNDNLHYPQTVAEIEALILNAPESGGGAIDVIGVDSTASLMSALEGTDKGDKRGSTKAKELHSMCRKMKAEVAKKSRLVVFTNQIQDVQDAMPFMPKEKTPGGHAVPFYSSIRMRIGPSGEGSKITKMVKIGGNEVKRVIGIRSTVQVIKSSIDAPYRDADVCIIFDYGVDDCRSCLEYIKKMTGQKVYWAVVEETNSLDAAIKIIEEGNLMEQLREETMNIWEEIEAKFRTERKPKER